MKGDPLKQRKFQKKSHSAEKNRERGPSGLGPVTAGFHANRLKSVQKSGTYRVRSVV